MELNKTLGNIGDRVDLVVSAGDDFGPHLVTLTNPDETPVDLTGAAILAKYVNVANPELSAEFVTTVTSAAAGQFTLSIPANVTATLPAGVHLNDSVGLGRWDCKLVDSQGRRVPLFYGDVRAKASVA